MSRSGHAADAAGPLAAAALETQINQIGSGLVVALEQLLAAIGHPRPRPSDLCQSLGVNKDLASKLLIALGKRDPLAVVYYMPGPEALRKLAAAVQRAGGDGVPEAALAALERSIADFDGLLRRESGGRAAFDALVSSWLPEARQRVESAARQFVYKGMSGIKGVSAELNTLAYVLHPAAPTDQAGAGLIDTVTVDGYVGLRRLRAGAPIHVSSGRLTPPGAQQQAVLTLDGAPVDALSANTLLEEFCSRPTPRLELKRVENLVHTLVAGDLVGMSSAVDLFFAEHTPAFLKQTAERSGERVTLSAANEIPSELLVLDVLLHRDVWPGCEPELLVHDTVVRGVAAPSDRTRDIDRLESAERITPLGTGVASCRISEAPRHVDLLRHVCDRMSWERDAFRCYRIRCDYPVYGSQVHMVFDRPVG